MGAKKLPSLYQIKVTLVGAKPPIWRRLLVHGNIKLDTFHDVIQYSMGWMNGHLHQFEKDGVLYGVPDGEFDFGFDLEDENKYRLSDLLKSEKDWLSYEYDFGDDWRHKIILEKILPFDASSGVAKCIKGKRACPPEDCGGIWGYENLLEIMSDPAHDEHEDMMEWLGEEFDPERFSLSEINTMLSKHIK